MEKIEFYQSKKRRLFGIITPLIGLVIFTIILLFFKNNNFKIELYIFILTMIVLILLNIKKKPTVILDSKGVTTRVNKIGLVKWEHIENFNIQKIINSEVIAIELKDNQKLLDEKCKIVSALIRTNIKKLGTPVCIPKQEFEIPIEEVLAKFIDFKLNLEKK